MACAKLDISWITAISPLYSHVTDLFGNVIVKLINIKLFDLLARCHYILNPPHTRSILGLSPSITFFNYIITRKRNDNNDFSLVTFPFLVYHAVVLCNALS